MSSFEPISAKQARENVRKISKESREEKLRYILQPIFNAIREKSNRGESGYSFEMPTLVEEFHLDWHRDYSDPEEEWLEAFEYLTNECGYSVFRTPSLDGSGRDTCYIRW